MSNRRFDDEIEAKILERDKLLARAQGTSERDHDRGRIELTMLAEHERMGARLANLEQALRYFADGEWVARASIEEMVAMARAALEGEEARPEEHWLSRVDRIARTA